MIRHFVAISSLSRTRSLAGSRRFTSTVNILDIAAEYVDTSTCGNQNDLARVLKHKLTTPDAFTAFQSVDRALFLPSATGYREPYENRPQQLGHGGATLSTPFHHAVVLSALHERGLSQAKSVLDVGCGTGWLTAAMFATVDKNTNGRVVGVDRVPDLVEEGMSALAKCPITKRGVMEKRITLMKAYNELDEFDVQALKPFEPFDVIHVGFTFDPKGDRALINLLCSLLSGPKAFMLAGFGQDLCIFDSNGMRKEIAHIPGMAPIQRGAYKRPLSRVERMDKAKKELEEWKMKFETQNKRKPSKEDLFKDPVASALFKEFSSASKLT